MRDHVHLGLPRSLLETGDRGVDLLVDLALVRHRPGRVVVDLVEPGRRVAVAHESHLLRLELRPRSLDAVDEEDRVLLEGGGASRLAGRPRDHEEKPQRREDRRDAPEPRSSAYNHGTPPLAAVNVLLPIPIMG
jgi:hypothetical protein